MRKTEISNLEISTGNLAGNLEIPRLFRNLVRSLAKWRIQTLCTSNVTSGNSREFSSSQADALCLARCARDYSLWTESLGTVEEGEKKDVVPRINLGKILTSRT